MTAMKFMKPERIAIEVRGALEIAYVKDDVSKLFDLHQKSVTFFFQIDDVRLYKMPILI